MTTRRWMRLWALLVLGWLGGAQAGEPTMQPLLRLETGMHTAVIRSIATDATGCWAVTASDDKTARIWSVASGELIGVLRVPQDANHEGKLYAVAMSPDGAQIAVGGWTGLDWDGQVSRLRLGLAVRTRHPFGPPHLAHHLVALRIVQ